ncbi:MAG: DUF2341 domain-containing protein, partial [Candidatus Thorarchaeota archaeon]
KDGDDILFTDSSATTQLDHEIEKYDHTAGDLTAWVRIPTLSSSTDTVIYMYYGNYTVANQENPTAVWDNNFTAVYHMSEDPSVSTDCDGGAGTFEICDSTQYDHDGHANGGLATDDLLAGQMGDAVEFDGEVINGGDDSYFNIPTTNELDFGNNEVTLEAWARLDIANSDDTPFIMRASGGNDEEFMLGVDGGTTPGALNFRTTDVDYPTAGNHFRYDHTGAFADNVWVSSAMKYNGTIPGADTGVARMFAYTDGTQLGAGEDAHGDNLRTTYIETRYNNEQTGSTFLTWGAEEPETVTVVIPISQGSDDMEEAAGGGLDTGSSDLEMMEEASLQEIGLRFNNVVVPNNATIISADVQFSIDQTAGQSGAVTITISGEKKDRPSTFAGAFNVSSRVKTSEKVNWSPDDWCTCPPNAVDDQGVNQETDDLAPIIEKIIDRPGWVSGNSLVLLLNGATGNTRVAQTFENNGVDEAPTLSITYVKASGVDSGAFIQPDAGAPGMNLAVELIGSGFSETDTVTTNSTDIIVGNSTIVVDQAGNQTATDGTILKTIFFINETALDQTVEVQVNGNPLTRVFEIFTPAANSGDYIGQGAGPHTLGDGTGRNGDRTVGGTIILENLFIPAGVDVFVDTADNDPANAGNQGYLPAIILVTGDVLIDGTLDISGSAGNAGAGDAGGDGGAGGPGGGGGGGGAGDDDDGGTGGDGFTGGGGGGDDGSFDNAGPGGAGSGSAGSPNVDNDGGAGGSSLLGNGTGGGGGQGTGADGGGGGGGTGFLYGFGGGGGSPADGTSGRGGGGGGDNGGPEEGGGGGFAEDGGTSGDGDIGLLHGNPQLSPLAGGSGGGGGGSDEDADADDGSGGGGGGGGAVLLYAQGTFEVNGAIDATGGAGGSCTDTGD